MIFDPGPLVLSFKLALVTTLLLLVIGLPLAWWLAFGKQQWKVVLESIVCLPLVLPPTVLGFYLLLLFSPRFFPGQTLEHLGIRVIFSFPGLVIGSVLFSLPFMVNPVKSAFQAFPVRLLEASYTLGRSKLDTFWRVVFPNVRSAVLAGVVMTFAHTLGEFGVVFMVGGNIPGQTRLASMAVYSAVESLDYAQAHVYAAVLVMVSLAVLVTTYSLNRKQLQII